MFGELQQPFLEGLHLVLCRRCLVRVYVDHCCHDEVLRLMLASCPENKGLMELEAQCRNWSYLAL